MVVLYAMFIVFGVVLLAVLSIFLFIRLGRVIAENREYTKSLRLLGERATVAASAPGDTRGAPGSRVRGLGLRVKIIFFITLLVVGAVVSISPILGSTLIRRLEQRLASDLETRVRIVLESIAAQTSAVVTNPTTLAPQLQAPQLQSIIEQAHLVPEVRYVTITARGKESAHFGRVWATTDTHILSSSAAEDQRSRSIDTEKLEPGVSSIEDDITNLIPPLRQSLNEGIPGVIGDLPADIARLEQEQLAHTDSPHRTAEIQSALIALKSELTQLLRSATPEVYHFPRYSSERIDSVAREYIFYKPIVALRHAAGAVQSEYYQGMVRIGVSTAPQVKAVYETRRMIVNLSVILIVVATVFGIVGASVLATVVVGPLFKVVKGVRIINATEDKTELKDYTIQVQSRDEIALLARGVNAMTQGLARAAEADKELILGKEIQKLYMPFDTSEDGKKLPLSHTIFPGLECAGYYEGAHGVSGDYFSYHALESGHIAIIKCDVSGSGVPAAFIMVEIATLFENYTTDISAKDVHATGMLSHLVTLINDTLAGMKFEGRFATLSMLLIDQNSGRVQIATAGDSRLYIYRAAQSAIETLDMPTSPPAGAFASAAIPHPFPEIVTTLHSNDYIVLFTDGLEQSRRVLRDSALKPRVLSDQELTLLNQQWHGAVKKESEEFGFHRISAITQAVIQRNTYKLEKVLNPVAHPALDFDFRTLTPNALNVALALMSVEKIFRLIALPPRIALSDIPAPHHVTVEEKLVQFLSTTYRPFAEWFSTPIHKNSSDLYTRYNGLLEDQQYDDITCLIIRRRSHTVR